MKRQKPDQLSGIVKIFVFICLSNYVWHVLLPVVYQIVCSYIKNKTTKYLSDVLLLQQNCILYVYKFKNK